MWKPIRVNYGDRIGGERIRMNGWIIVNHSFSPPRMKVDIFTTAKQAYAIARRLNEPKPLLNNL